MVIYVLPDHINIYLLVVSTPLKEYEFVSWDYDIPIFLESHKIHVPKHQPIYVPSGYLT